MTCRLLLIFRGADRHQQVHSGPLQSEAPQRESQIKAAQAQDAKPTCDPELHFLSVFVQQEAATGQEAAPKRR